MKIYTTTEIDISLDDVMGNSDRDDKFLLLLDLLEFFKDKSELEYAVGLVDDTHAEEDLFNGLSAVIGLLENITAERD